MTHHRHCGQSLALAANQGDGEGLRCLKPQMLGGLQAFLDAFWKNKSLPHQKVASSRCQQSTNYVGGKRESEQRKLIKHQPL